MKPLKEQTEAVSPVIGVILMVAITVVLAAVVFVLVSDIGNQPEEAPRVILQTEDGGGNFTVISTNTDIPWSDILIGGNGCMPEAVDEFFSAGDIIAGCQRKLTVVHRPSDTVIYNYP